jgi:hypothetical protein
MNVSRENVGVAGLCRDQSGPGLWLAKMSAPSARRASGAAGRWGCRAVEGGAIQRW